MIEWELARYLIDAKKNIDSLLFIQLNIDKLTNLNIKERFDKIQMEFYLKLCYILDDVFKKKKKPIICSSNKIIKSIYDERDKNNAHKDKDYIPKNILCQYLFMDYLLILSLIQIICEYAFK